jgi:RNA polymerase sigma factor (sigma-70 family)
MKLNVPKILRHWSADQRSRIMTDGESAESAPYDLGQRASFETTQWSVVLAAGQDSAKARPALEALCRAYWLPLFVFVRRRGYAVPDAQDLVQGFFARLLERNDLAAVRKERGRFRSYLLGALKHHLVNDWKRASADKRGGGEVPIPLDQLMCLNSGDAMASDQRSPDQAFDRQWALALLDRVLTGMREEQRIAGNEKQFECLQGFLVGSEYTRSQAEIAAELGLSEGAVKQAVFRLRQRYQAVLRMEIAATVATLGDVEEELRNLIAALRV